MRIGSARATRLNALYLPIAWARDRRSSGLSGLSVPTRRRVDFRVIGGMPCSNLFFFIFVNLPLRGLYGLMGKYWLLGFILIKPYLTQRSGISQVLNIKQLKLYQ